MNIRIAALGTRAAAPGCRPAPGEETTRMHKHTNSSLEGQA